MLRDVHIPLYNTQGRADFYSNISCFQGGKVNCIPEGAQNLLVGLNCLPNGLVMPTWLNCLPEVVLALSDPLNYS
jgi:hypothetical protein